MSISNFSILCSLLCICAVAKMYDNEWMLENKHSYIFLYGVIDFYNLSNNQVQTSINVAFILSIRIITHHSVFRMRQITNS